MAVEIPLPEHCCSNGSKPRWVWGPFWLFLTVENQAGPKKDFFVKKMGIWGSAVVQIEEPLPCRALLQQWKQTWVVLGAFLAAFDGCNSSWAEKIKFRKKNWGVPQNSTSGVIFFYPNFFSVQQLSRFSLNRFLKHKMLLYQKL